MFGCCWVVYRGGKEDELERVEGIDSESEELVGK